MENEAGLVRRRTLGGAFQRPFLIAFDLSPHHANKKLEEDVTIRAAFPRKTLDVIERVRRVVNTIRPANNLSDVGDGVSNLRLRPVSMHIERTPEEYCGVCGVDSLEGEGSARCNYQQSCDDSFVSSISTAAMQLSNPSSSQATDLSQLTSGQQLMQTSDTAEARYVILASLDVITTAANSTPFNMATLKDALSYSLGLAVDDPYQAISGEEAVQVEVVPSAVDELFGHMFPDDLRNEGGRRFLEERGDGNGPVMMESQRHRVMLVTASPSKKEGILEALGVDDTVQQASRRLWALDEARGPGTGTEDARPGNASNFAARIAAFVHERGGDARSSVERVEVGFERMLSIPESDAAHLVSGLGAFETDLGEMSVMVTDPRMPLKPVGHVEYGKSYRLVVDHFPPHSIIRVAALRTAIQGEEEDESDRVVRVLPTLITDETGAALVPNLKFSSARLFPPGNYEIQVLVSGTQEFGLSPLFTLSHEGPKRKLFRF